MIKYVFIQYENTQIMINATYTIILFGEFFYVEPGK